MDIKLIKRLMPTIISKKDLAKVLLKASAETVAEIGVRQGRGLEILYGSGCNLLVGVDMWKDVGKINVSRMDQNELDKQYLKTRSVVKNLRRRGKRSIRIVRKESAKAAKLFPDNYFDCIYIDADHSYEGVKTDLKTWFPKMKHGGVFSGHDYWDSIHADGSPFGVVHAVDEFLMKTNFKLWLAKDRLGKKNIWMVCVE